MTALVVVGLANAKIPAPIPTQRQAQKVAKAPLHTGAGSTPEEQVAYMLDKGFISTPSWVVERGAKLNWVYRSRPHSFWQ